MSRVLGTEVEVLALAPDAASVKAAKGLQSIRKWPSVGSSATAVWGECQGSGSKPYQTQVDLSGPSFKCSCPSRKFPCKHGLALMLLRAAGEVPEGGDAPEWVQAWQTSRQQKAEKKAEQQERKASAPPPNPAAVARRVDKRWDNISAGMQELALWMQDMVAQGLASLSGNPQASAQWRTLTARMVDAQAPGMATRLQRAWTLVDSHPDWHRELLLHLGQWHLLHEAVQRQGSLDADTRADLMAALGWPLDRAEVVAQGQAVTDTWVVAGLHHTPREGNLLERRVWLQGLHSGRVALLLDYAQGGRGFETAWLAGRSYHSVLHFYPGRTPLRALLPVGQAPALLAQQDEHDGALTQAVVGTARQALDSLARRVADNPFQTLQPLWMEQAALRFHEGRWWLHGAEDAPSVAVVLEAQAGWQLLAMTGGQPVQWFGEWEYGHWHLRSAWQAIRPDDARNALHCIWHDRGETA